VLSFFFDDPLNHCRGFLVVGPSFRPINPSGVPGTPPPPQKSPPPLDSLQTYLRSLPDDPFFSLPRLAAEEPTTPGWFPNIDTPNKNFLPPILPRPCETPRFLPFFQPISCTDATPPAPFHPPTFFRRPKSDEFFFTYFSGTYVTFAQFPAYYYSTSLLLPPFPEFETWR